MADEARELKAQEIAAILSEHYAGVLEGMRGEVEAGSGDALLSALLTALISRDPLPEWLANQVAAAIYRHQNHDASTLDEAFRVTRPEGYRQKARREQRRKGMLLAFDVRRLIQAGAVVDDALFAAVGGLYGVGKTTAAKWYYWHAGRSYLPPTDREAARSALPEKLQSIATEIAWRR